MLLPVGAGLLFFERGTEMSTVKIGPVELTEQEIQAIYEAGLYIVTYTKVYQLFYSVASRQYYGQLVYEMNRAKGQPGFVKRGRFATLSAINVNRLVGFDLLAF